MKKKIPEPHVLEINPIFHSPPAPPPLWFDWQKLPIHWEKTEYRDNGIFVHVVVWTSSVIWQPLAIGYPKGYAFPFGWRDFIEDAFRRAETYLSERKAM